MTTEHIVCSAHGKVRSGNLRRCHCSPRHAMSRRLQWPLRPHQSRPRPEQGIESAVLSLAESRVTQCTNGPVFLSSIGDEMSSSKLLVTFWASRTSSLLVGVGPSSKLQALILTFSRPGLPETEYEQPCSSQSSGSINLLETRRTPFRTPSYSTTCGSDNSRPALILAAGHWQWQWQLNSVCIAAGLL